jgi:hypothetical protein
MATSLLVIINQFNIASVPVLESKYDSPVGSNGRGPKALAISFELMKTIAGEI